MAYREVHFMRIEEIVRRHAAGQSIRAIARGTGLAPNTVAAYVQQHQRRLSVVCAVTNPNKGLQRGGCDSALVSGDGRMCAGRRIALGVRATYLAALRITPDGRSLTQ
ncbi:MAG: hypothetical protein U0821_06825 [Chloroflexota bacterium]